MKKNCLPRLRFLVFCSGWIFAIALVVGLLPTLRQKFFLRFPSCQKAEFERTVAAKKQQLASPWEDHRPLTIFAGDSHVELGDWYELFDGSVATRNCGLTSAGIADVNELVSGIVDREPKNLVLMCGVNDLGRGESIASCVTNYERLILNVHSTVNPRKTIVLSVMPVRNSAVDGESRSLNGRIVEFNRELEAVCGRNRAQFVDITPEVAAPDGGLSPELTKDGLHLNPQGYRRLADILAGTLSASD